MNTMISLYLLPCGLQNLQFQRFKTFVVEKTYYRLKVSREFYFEIYWHLLHDKYYKNCSVTQKKINIIKKVNIKIIAYLQLFGHTKERNRTCTILPSLSVYLSSLHIVYLVHGFSMLTILLLKITLISDL